MYVKLDGNREICEKNSSPKNKGDWVEVDDFNCKLGDKVETDLTLTPKAPDDSRLVWEWAQTWVIDNDPAAEVPPVTARWLKCVQVGARQSMAVDDWADLRTFRNSKI